MTDWARACGLFCALLLFINGAARAAPRLEPVTPTVMDRAAERIQPVGIRIGGFMLRPQSTATLRVDSNVFVSEADPRTDFWGDFGIRAEARSLWSRHALTLTATADRAEHARFRTEDGTQWSTALAGRVDVARAVQVDLDGRVGRLIQPRNATGAVVDTLRPLRFNLAEGGGTITYQGSRTMAVATAHVARYDYTDAISRTGAPIDTSLQDRRITTASLRLQRAISPSLAGFVSADTVWRDRYHKGAGGSLAGNSSGYTLLAGLHFDLRKLRGDVAAGYLRETIRSTPALPPVASFTVRTKLDWLVTGLTTASLYASRSVIDADAIGSRGVLLTEARLSVDHELLRTLILSADGGLSRGTFRALDRRDRRRQLGFAVKWLLRRSLTVDLSARSLRQRSVGTIAGPRYESRSASLGATAFF